MNKMKLKMARGGRREGSGRQRGDTRRQRAFSRLELLVVVTVLGALVSTAWPGLVNQRHRYDRVACVNNLRQIGEGYHAWGADHGGNTPLWTSTAQGGLRNFSGLSPYGASPANCWFNFLGLSNQLAAPRVLVCPADTSKVRNIPLQESWLFPPGNSLAGMRDNAVSYAIGAHAQTGYPNELLALDRNFRFDGFATCEVGINNLMQFDGTATSQAGWTNAIHWDGGNVLTMDGHVAETTTSGLRALLTQPGCQSHRHIIAPAGPVIP